MFNHSFGFASYEFYKVMMTHQGKVNFPLFASSMLCMFTMPNQGKLNFLLDLPRMYFIVLIQGKVNFPLVLPFMYCVDLQ